MSSTATLVERINRKLALQFALPLFGCFLVAAAIGSLAINESVEKSLNEQLSQRANVAIDSAQIAVESANTLGTIQRYISALGAEDEFNSVTVVAGNPLRVIAATQLDRIGKSLAELDSTNLSAMLELSLKSRKKLHSRLLQDRFLYSSSIYILGVSERGKPLGKGAVVLELTPQKYQVAKQHISRTLILVMTFTLGAILLCTLFLLNRLILLPQKQLLRVVEQRKRNEKILSTVKGSNEISAISQSLNELFVANDQVDELKSQFVSIVSHELRTPLTSIRGALGLVLGAFSHQLEPDTRKLLSTAERNAEQLARLINDLLDLEKMTSGKMTFQMEPTDLCGLMQEAVNTISPYAVKHKVNIRLQLPATQQSAVVDKTRITQALFNLLSNAIKFSNEGQSVILSLSESQEFHRVSVKDYGRGIPEEFRARIFQRFAQADSKDSREKGGTGLGLNIVQMIVNHHRGKIEFFSEPGKGTEFIIMLPK